MSSKSGKVVKLIRESINKELNDRNTINVCLYMFLENRSCQTNLISFLDEITDLIDKGNGIGIIDTCKHNMPSLFELIPSVDSDSSQPPATIFSSHIFHQHGCHKMVGKVRT